MAGFISAQREQHGVPHATACRAVGVSQAWFYKWRDGDPSPRHARRAGLAITIGRLFAKRRELLAARYRADGLRRPAWRTAQLVPADRCSRKI